MNELRPVTAKEWPEFWSVLETAFHERPWPEGAEEVHEALLWMGYVTAEEAVAWQSWIDELSRHAAGAAPAEQPPGASSLKLGLKR